MIAKMMLAFLAGGIIASATDGIASGTTVAAVERDLKIRLNRGASNDELTSVRVTLATAYMEAGANPEAESVLRDAQKSLGDGICRADLLNAWGMLHLKLDRLQAAEAELREALRVAAGGELTATIEHNLASVEMRTGRYGEALGHERDAIGRMEETLAPDHPTLIRARASLASLQYMMGQPREAKESMDRAIRSAEITYGPTHPLVADLLMSDALVLEKLKLRGDARRARRRAAAISGGRLPVTNVNAVWNIAEPPAGGQVYLRTK